MDTTVAATLKERLTGRVARYADRREDWSVFGFETALDPRYARAQRRYLGASAPIGIYHLGHPEIDRNGHQRDRFVL